MALNLLERDMKEKSLKEKADSEFPFVPGPEKLDDLLLEEQEASMEDKILQLMRFKRSVDDTAQEVEKENDTIKFYHAVDELNEDTLKDLNVSGTLPAQKVNTMPQISRRTSMLNNSSSSLQIEYTQPKENNHHDDNKVDTLAIHDDKEDLLAHSNIYDVMGNYSQDNKDKELSKLLVNELKGGVSETIGDKKAPIISNITFTPANDTLTAMAFIAGNLLNKLWNMEKDVNDDDIDTEVLKHEKIADLLDLFKEPLSMRQEMFLKNALEQLSTALNKNKDLDSISLCKHLEVKRTFDKQNDQVKTDCNKKEHANIESKSTATTEALNKINNVLDLLKKYENVRNRLGDMKSRNLNKIMRSESNQPEKEITEDEKTSLDLYGKTLETITKLLIPNKRNKKVVKTLQNDTIFKTGKGLKNKLLDMKLDNLNITTKDKMLLDYLAHIQSNPDCLLKTHHDKVSIPSIEGNILLNLSEFFKIKSLSDLVKLVETDKNPEPSLRLRTITTQKPMKKSTTESSVAKDSPKQFSDTKEKLKGHLKSILEDLMELQKIEGKDSKNKDSQIMEALPCIYNLLNAGKKESITSKPTLDTTPTTSIDKSLSGKVTEIFTKLKNDLKFDQTRRKSTLSGPRPKSAVVWERMIKNTQGKQKINSRRNLGNVPKSYEELKVLMDEIESSGSNTYKNYAYLHEVPPAEKLLLLKTFKADTIKYAKALETIMESLQAESSISKEGVREINEFVDNAAMNINLNEKVIKNLDKPKKVYDFTNNANPKRQMRNKEELKREHPINSQLNSHSPKLTRDQIINQLIKNRILLYVETKEAAQEIHNDMNYNVAKTILLHLDLGNFQVARELYKVFTSLKQKDSMIAENKNIELVRDQTSRLPTRRKQVQPIIEFENPTTVNKKTQKLNQDHFIKQLFNLKNMKL